MYLHMVPGPCLREELRSWDIQWQVGVHSQVFHVELVCGLGVLSEGLLDIFALMSSGRIQLGDPTGDPELAEGII